MKKIFYNVGRVLPLAFITTMLTMAPSAKATTWTLNDYMSSSTIANWSCWSGPYGSCKYIKGETWAFDTNFLFTDFFKVFGSSGWSDVGRPVTIPYIPQYSYQVVEWCKAQTTVVYDPFSGTLNNTVQLEVINADSWTYVTTTRKSFTHSWSSEKYLMSTAWFSAPTKNIFVRLGVIDRGAIAMNDLKVTCSY